MSRGNKKREGTKKIRNGKVCKTQSYKEERQGGQTGLEIAPGQEKSKDGKTSGNTTKTQERGTKRRGKPGNCQEDWSPRSGQQVVVHEKTIRKGGWVKGTQKKGRAERQRGTMGQGGTQT